MLSADLRAALVPQCPAQLALTLAVRQATAYDLAALLASAGLRVVVSATVPVALPPVTAIPAVHLTDAAAWARLGGLLAAQGRVAALGEVERADRVRGLDNRALARLSSRADVDTCIVIADGSRHRPAKAPAEHEPAVPPGTTHLLPMLSLDALDQPLAEEHVHRPERLAAVLNVGGAHRLTSEDLATLLLSPDGGRKGMPVEAAYWPVLYGITGATQAVAGALSARLLRAENVTGVLLQRKGERQLVARMRH